MQSRLSFSLEITEEGSVLLYEGDFSLCLLIFVFFMFLFYLICPIAFLLVSLSIILLKFFLFNSLIQLFSTLHRFYTPGPRTVPWKQQTPVVQLHQSPVVSSVIWILLGYKLCFITSNKLSLSSDFIYYHYTATICISQHFTSEIYLLSIWLIDNYYQYAQ